MLTVWKRNKTLLGDLRERGPSLHFVGTTCWPTELSVQIWPSSCKKGLVQRSCDVLAKLLHLNYADVKWWQSINYSPLLPPRSLPLLKEMSFLSSKPTYYPTTNTAGRHSGQTTLTAGLLQSVLHLLAWRFPINGAQPPSPTPPPSLRNFNMSFLLSKKTVKWFFIYESHPFSSNSRCFYFLTCHTSSMHLPPGLIRYIIVSAWEAVGGRGNQPELFVVFWQCQHTDSCFLTVKCDGNPLNINKGIVTKHSIIKHHMTGRQITTDTGTIFLSICVRLRPSGAVAGIYASMN